MNLDEIDDLGISLILVYLQLYLKGHFYISFLNFYRM